MKLLNSISHSFELIKLNIGIPMFVGIFFHSPSSIPFSSPTKSQSFGALSLKKHLLTRLWEMTLEQGDLFLLALVVLFCRAFVMADQSDFGRFLEGQNSVDWDLVVIMMGNMLDRMDLFNKKMEFLKFVKQSKMTILRSPVSRCLYVMLV